MLRVEAHEDKKTASWDIKFIAISKRDWDTLRGVTDLIKATVPASHRTYNPDTKIWSLLAENYSILKLACTTMGIDWFELAPKVTEENFFYEETLRAPVIVTKESLAAQLCKLLEVSSEILTDTNAAKKAYRAAAMKLHPDRNAGDGSKMSELNSIWSAYNAN